jgi:MFS transporter, OFA family, oxalate/formate antiporter
MIPSEPFWNHPGWRVTFTALGINLALGILYTWSVISNGIPDAWNWSQADRSMPYAVACLVFCIVMVPAGRMQDRYGPRLVATVGGLLVGAGMIFASFTTTPLGYVLGFGVLTGAGIGAGYASATPPALKWFTAARTGLIAGVVVSGFGLASVYAAPLANWLIGKFGVSSTVLYLGLAFMLIVTGLAQLLKVPPRGYIPAGYVAPVLTDGIQRKEEYGPREMIRTWQFYVLWFMLACGAGAGLMIISSLAKIASVQAGMVLGCNLVAVLAIGNGGGRILAGFTSDRIGRKATLFLCFVMQAGLILILSQTTTGSWLAHTAVLAPVCALIGANYGANLALFPSVTKDYFGMRHLGINYGLVFTSWGLGGFLLALFAGRVYDATQTFAFAYYASAILLVVAATATLFLKPPQRVEHREAVPA